MKFDLFFRSLVFGQKSLRMRQHLIGPNFHQNTSRHGQQIFAIVKKITYRTEKFDPSSRNGLFWDFYWKFEAYFTKLINPDEALQHIQTRSNEVYSTLCSFKKLV